MSLKLTTDRELDEFDEKHHFPANVRAKLLGHSIETNEKYYSYCSKNDDMGDIRKCLNESSRTLVTPQSHSNIIMFRNEKKPEFAKLKALRKI